MTLFILIVACSVLLTIVMSYLHSMSLDGWALNRADQKTIFFLVDSKKTLASGVPMAQI